MLLIYMWVITVDYTYNKGALFIANLLFYLGLAYAILTIILFIRGATVKLKKIRARPKDP